MDCLKQTQRNFVVRARILATWKVIQVSSGNQTMVAWVRIVQSQYPRSFLQGERMILFLLVSSFEFCETIFLVFLCFYARFTNRWLIYANAWYPNFIIEITTQSPMCAMFLRRYWGIELVFSYLFRIRGWTSVIC